jgi:hypothetical protein
MLLSVVEKLIRSAKIEKGFMHCGVMEVRPMKKGDESAAGIDMTQIKNHFCFVTGGILAVILISLHNEYQGPGKAFYDYDTDDVTIIPRPYINHLLKRNHR